MQMAYNLETGTPGLHNLKAEGFNIMSLILVDAKCSLCY